jgi:U3 small nucleolar RNA-associated protein 14
VDNPWMLRPEVKDNEKLQLYYTGYKKLWEDINEKKQKEIRKQEVQLDELREELNEEVVEKMQDGESFDVDDDAEAKTIEEIDSASDTPKNVATPNTPKTKGKKRKLKQKKKTAKQSKLDDDDEEENEFATLDIDSLMNKAEEKMRLKVEKELKELNKKERLQQKRMEKEKKRKAFREKKTKKQREGDADEIREFEVDSNEQIMESTNGGGAEERPSTDPGSKKKAVENTNTTKDQSPLLLNPNNFLKVKTSKTTTGSKFDGSNVNIDWDEEGDEVIAEEEDAQESQRMIIAEAFEDDDVVDEFKRMKESEIEASKPKDIDLHLPGWGEWGGKDLKPNPKRREKFIIKAPPQAPRKDAHLSHVILNQEAGERIREHQVYS